jgi:3,4-dihydroxyphenylacetate 2,3-dioxygenase
MGAIVFAAKITHVPSIWLSLQPGRFHGIRQNAVDGGRNWASAPRARGADTFLVVDVHWQNSMGFHLEWQRLGMTGAAASHELPHFIHALEYDYRGAPELAKAIGAEITAAGLRAYVHDLPDLGLEYGTLVPMHLMNADRDLAVVPMGSNVYSSIDENRRVGEAIRKAIDASGLKVALLASGSLSHQFPPNAIAETKLNEIPCEFKRQVDLRVLELWRDGRIKEFLAMLPDYAERCTGESGMADTGVLFGALGWEAYQGKGEQIGRYFCQRRHRAGEQSVFHYELDRIRLPAILRSGSRW